MASMQGPPRRQKSLGRIWPFFGFQSPRIVSFFKILLILGNVGRTAVFAAPPLQEALSFSCSHSSPNTLRPFKPRPRSRLPSPHLSTVKPLLLLPGVPNPKSEPLHLPENLLPSTHTAHPEICSPPPSNSMCSYKLCLPLLISS